MPMIRAGERQLSYVTSPRSGAPVLFIQGVGVPGCGWTPQTDALQSNFWVTSFDNRGIGNSDLGKDPLTIDLFARDALAVLDHLDIESAHVVGHSMGGVIASQLALNAPERIRSLSLLCTFLKGKNAAKINAWKIWVGLRCHLGTRKMRRFAFQEMVFSRQELETVDRDAFALEAQSIFGRDLAEQPSIVMKQVNALSKHDCSALLGSLAHIPSLVISGAQDRMAPPSEGRALAEAISGEYQEWGGTAHGLPITQKDQLNSTLEKFFIAHT